ncbi:MAG: DUF5127 domain-containing protein [Christensenellales bacterium]
MGRRLCGKNMTQKSVKLTAFTTEYEFTCDAFDLAVAFVSPLLPDDLTVLSNPVCYMNYTLKPKTELKDVKVMLVVGDEICYDKVAMPIHGGVMTLPQGQTSWFGLKKQLLMSQSSDSSAAEWGHWYITGQKAAVTDDAGVIDLYENGIVHNRSGAKNTSLLTMVMIP